MRCLLEPKVVNRGGGFIFKFDKNSTNILVSDYNLGGLGALFGDDKPTKIPLCGDGTAYAHMHIKPNVRLKPTVACCTIVKQNQCHIKVAQRK